VILLTVGSQLPFCRLTRAVDAWCAATGRSDVMGQIGAIGPESYRPKHFKWEQFISPGKFDELTMQADLIIAHAGMGSIIGALRNAKPIVIMPRKASLGEHRNEHQMATASRFAGRQNVYVADDETVLAATLQRAAGDPASAMTISPFADRKLITSLRSYILNGAADRDNAPELMGKREGAPG
jgi:UDP-N-acetylglucosamine transferase subunit ALG13